MRIAYPPIQPYRERQLAVDDLHTLHVEECGNPDGVPVLFVHGGPGAGFTPTDRCFFDPEFYRIVLFDQRGAGRSVPHAELSNNRTDLLVSDMEAIRQALGIEQWLLFGGSWGSTLSLVYAETHPERVLGLILRGIFLCRPEDISWFYQHGASRIFPDAWQDFIEPIPEAERHALLPAFHRRLTGSNELERLAAARAWSTWEGRCATLDPNPALVGRFADTHTALSLARIEAHYFINDSFLEPNQILRDAHKLQDIPGVIVHGRYDMVCPVDQAFALHQAWPTARLQIIRDAGHASGEAGIRDALVHATDEFRGLLGVGA